MVVDEVEDALSLDCCCALDVDVVGAVVLLLPKLGVGMDQDESPVRVLK